MLPPFLKKIRITTGFLYDSGQSILSHLDTLVRGRLVYRQTRRGIGQRSDLRKIKKPFSIGLGATHFSRQLWQSCSDKHNGQATLSGAMQRSDQRRQFLLFDELQYVEEEELAALITALHRTAQRSLPVVLVGAGLPQLPGKMGRAKSYAERLFDFPQIGPLSDAAARLAINKPAADQGVEVAEDALARIIQETRGYPYFLQEWGKHSWDAASESPITLQDVERATSSATAALDESFFRVRFDRLTPLEKKYLRAMAELGPGPHRSGDIAERLGRVVTSLGPIRSQLIVKGMIWSPSHGDTAFTVPLFDEFMRRIMPGDEWKQ